MSKIYGEREKILCDKRISKLVSDRAVLIRQKTDMETKIANIDAALRAYNDIVDHVNVIRARCDVQEDIGF